MFSLSGRLGGHAEEGRGRRLAGNTSAPGASVVSRAVALLTAFDAEHRRLTLSELARRAGLPHATTHRLARELVRGGLLVRRPSGEYVVGRRLWDIGLLAPVESGLREVASPFLNDLHAATLATVHLAIREGRHALYVERLSGRASVPVVSGVGLRLPLPATGVGKVLLAHAPERVREEVLATLTPFTPYTVVQPVRLRRQLQQVLREDVATTQEEMTLGACSIAVPVRRGGAPDGDVVAAVGFVVPSLKRDRSKLHAALRVAAHGIGRSLDRPLPTTAAPGGP
jgi:DNA-binding IclR family transcriptional regulator